MRPVRIIQCVLFSLQKVFGLDHIYGGATCMSTYKCLPHDPEGETSKQCISLIASILFVFLLRLARLLDINRHDVLWRPGVSTFVRFLL